ncbi:hypothetical protein AB0N09_08705 [Streptomyces erythrochromogenes]|uniref:hypothetical protein n=1 Tax=Streptomyces erythrochromogenes TaxID=285574 RepID=UPI00342A6798
MRDPRLTPLVAAPGCPPQAGPLPCCPVCDGVPERISWRQRPEQPVLLVFDPCGHRWSTPAEPVLAVTPPRAHGHADAG